MYIYIYIYILSVLSSYLEGELGILAPVWAQVGAPRTVAFPRPGQCLGLTLQQLLYHHAYTGTETGREGYIMHLHIDMKTYI
jgi:hypothetical protein